jgi:predicted secreted protein
MALTSIIAIYSLFWVMSAFLVLPFGVRNHNEAGIPLVPGQADGAPAEFRPGRIALRATVLSIALFALFYANYTQAWVTADSFTGLIAEPPRYDGKPASPR